MVRSTGRRPKRRDQTKIVKVLTEGTVTERQYIKYMQKVAPRDCGVRLRLGAAISNPNQLVSKAVRELEYDKRRKEGRIFDEIWCIFDYDAHFRTLSELLTLIDYASSNDICVAFSNPCFELWLVIHCESVASQVHRNSMQNRADDLKLVDRKNIREAALIGFSRDYDIARQRAKSLVVQHQLNGKHEGSNPSTTIWALVDMIRG